MNFEILISFVIATATLAFSPGPDNIFVLIQSATFGKKSGMAVVCGLMTGCLVHTSLVAFGLSSFLQINEKLYWIFKLFGAIYMLYLAVKVYKSQQNTKPDSNKDDGKDNKDKKDDNVVDADFEEVKEEKKDDGNQEKSA